MKCENLTQEKAHHILYPWLKVFGSNLDFEKAFLEEVKRCRDKIEFWALPKDKRSYYTVSLDNRESPYLLLGIDSTSLNISSVAKVTKDEEKMGISCLRFFLEGTLLNELRKKFPPQRHDLYATASTLAGKKLFERLKKNLPEGITNITPWEIIGASFSEPNSKNFEITTFKIEYKL